MDFQYLKVNLDMSCQYIVTFVYHLAHIRFLTCTTTTISQSECTIIQHQNSFPFNSVATSFFSLNHNLWASSSFPCQWNHSMFLNAPTTLTSHHPSDEFSISTIQIKPKVKTQRDSPFIFQSRSNITTLSHTYNFILNNLSYSFTWQINT